MKAFKRVFQTKTPGGAAMLPNASGPPAGSSDAMPSCVAQVECVPSYDSKSGSNGTCSGVATTQQVSMEVCAAGTASDASPMETDASPAPTAALPVTAAHAAPVPPAATNGGLATPSAANGGLAAQAQKPNDSVTIAMSRLCPPVLRRQNWSLDDFELRKMMYNGAISMVYHAVDKRSGITLALKLYKRHKLNEIERHQVAREIKLHVDLAHDSIIAMYAAWKDRSYVYIALEWAPGGDVYAFMKSQKGRLAEEVAVPLILEPFMAGLRVIHDKGLIHRDIKPENILLNNSYQVKIADFGLSIDSRQEIANTRLGTIDYLAPEILDCPVKAHPLDFKDKPATGYSNKVDCWSVGVLAYELLCGYPPFQSPSAQETLRLIRTKRVEYPDFLTPGALDFIKSVLVRDPLQRPSIAQLLEHPWLARYSRHPEQPAAQRCRRAPVRSVSGGEAVLRSHTDLGGASIVSSAQHHAPYFTAGAAQAYAQQQTAHAQMQHTVQTSWGPMAATGGSSGFASSPMPAHASAAAKGAPGQLHPLPGAGMPAFPNPSSPRGATGNSSDSPSPIRDKAGSLLARKFKFWSNASPQTAPPTASGYSFNDGMPSGGLGALLVRGPAAGIASPCPSGGGLLTTAGGINPSGGVAISAVPGGFVVTSDGSRGGGGVTPMQVYFHHGPPGAMNSEPLAQLTPGTQVGAAQGPLPAANGTRIPQLPPLAMPAMAYEGQAPSPSSASITGRLMAVRAP